MAPETTPTKVPAETSLKGVADLLGGPRQLGGIVDDPLALHDCLVRGLPASALKYFAHHCPLLAKDPAFGRVLGSAPAPDVESRSGRSGRLSSHESGQLWRVAVILVKAAPLLGGAEAAERWLVKPAIGLGRRRPLDLLETPAGYALVSDHLTQLEFGVYV
jgi:putative toxin-antitoxin system antitoxin component (TIGR02293 family)